MISDWLSSTEGRDRVRIGGEMTTSENEFCCVDPEEVDIDVFNEYLEELMDQWNLETIVTLLRYFKR